MPACSTSRARAGPGRFVPVNCSGVTETPSNPNSLGTCAAASPTRFATKPGLVRQPAAARCSSTNLAR